MGKKETVNPEEGVCVRNLEDEVPLSSLSPVDRYSTLASISSQRKKKSMETDFPSESNDFMSGINKHVFDLQPVSPMASGEGLPYAPIDWPNPGDIWGWKVGRRISKSGYYQDRYLFLPRRLQKPTHRKEGFSSQCALKKYIQKVDPKVNIAAFFASFSWRVLPKTGSCSQPGKEVEEEIEKEIPFTVPRREWKRAKLPLRVIYKRQTRQSTKWLTRFSVNDTGVIDLCSPETSDQVNKDLKSTSDFECDQVSSHQAAISPAGSFVAHCNSPASSGVPEMELPQESGAKVIPDDFDNFINSLDDILAQPLPQASVFPRATDDSGDSEEGIAEARTKLSSYLAMDFELLVSSQDLNELALLSSKLQKDPSLDADQLSKLKLIEEIPVTGKDFLETMHIIEEANKFFADLNSNMDKASSLKNEYNASKEDIAILQVEIETSSSAIREIDDQIAQLQSQRDELISVVEGKKKNVAELVSTQGMVADSLPKVVHDVQLANSERPEWEQKKKIAAKREAEILEKLAPLRGFSL